MGIAIPISQIPGFRPVLPVSNLGTVSIPIPVFQNYTNLSKWYLFALSNNTHNISTPCPKTSGTPTHKLVQNH